MIMIETEIEMAIKFLETITMIARDHDRNIQEETMSHIIQGLEETITSEIKDRKGAEDGQDQFLYLRTKINERNHMISF